MSKESGPGGRAGRDQRGCRGLCSEAALPGNQEGNPPKKQGNSTANALPKDENPLLRMPSDSSMRSRARGVPQALHTTYIHTLTQSSTLP